MLPSLPTCSLVRRAIAVAVLLAPPGASASGLELDDPTPAGAALAGAVSARPGDASMLLYNPAGLVLTPAPLSVSIGGSLAVASHRFASAASVSDSLARAVVSPAVFVSARVGPRIAVGLGVYAPAGADVAWVSAARASQEGTRFPGERLATASLLQTTAVGPAVALQLMPGLAVGLGAEVVIATLELARQVALADPQRADVTQRQRTTAIGLGASAGLMVQAVPDRVWVGLALRSAVALDHDGISRSEVAPGTWVAEPATTALPLPMRLRLGVAVLPADGFSVSVEARLALWSQLPDLRLAAPRVVAADPSTPATIPLQLHDTLSVGAGLEWRARFGLVLRGGLGFDPSPLPSATLGTAFPSSDRVVLAAGLAYSLGRGAASGLGLSLGYQAGLSVDRPALAPALAGSTYSTSSHRLVAAITYAWEPAPPPAGQKLALSVGQQ